MTNVLGQWGLPPDGVASALAVLALVIGLLHKPICKGLDACTSSQTRWWVAIFATCAALGSLGYYQYYLRGGPRIIDATHYWLQAKTFATGQLSIPLLQPSASVRGRFLHYNLASGRLSVLFPPGYAAILALGMKLKTPWLVGPTIAAAIVVMTAAVAQRAFSCRRAAVIAAVLSTTCMALRYHTADTLSHGWAALLFAIAVWGALGNTTRDAVTCGLSAGWLWSTRPFTALALVALLLLFGRNKTQKSWWVWCLCFLPGFLAWFAYQRITTGNWFETTQSAYYALADGPPGCFRYGFGSGIGCHFEHGTYVANRLPTGYGFVSALTVSAVRLRWHMLDVLNFEPLWLLVVVAAAVNFRNPASKLLLSAPILLLLVYAPFYFDGNFPGGGARMLADTIPLEHALIASWLAYRWRFVPVIVLSLLGFSLHGAYEHDSLKRREGGHPMFEARTLTHAGVMRGLVLVDTDHGFGLGHEPGAHDAKQGLVIARARHDAHDWALWQSLGFPSLYYYGYDPLTPESSAKVSSKLLMRPLSPRFEAEAEWPVLAISDAWAIPGYPPCACVSQQQALIVRPGGPRPTVTLALPVQEAGQYRLRVGWVKLHDESTEIGVALNKSRWKFTAIGQKYQCDSAVSPMILIGAGEQRLQIQLGQDDLAVDYVQLESAN